MEDLIPLLIQLGIVLLFVILGVLFSAGRGGMLIAGYNTMSKHERARFDEKAMCRFMGKFMFALAGSWLILTFGMYFSVAALTVLGAVLFAVFIIAGIIYMNTKNRFKKW